MKTILLALAAGSFALLTATAADRSDQWKAVNEAISKGRPQTAIEALDPIIEAALKEKAYGEAANAISQKIVLEGNIQGNKPEEKIVRLQAEIKKSPKEMVPILTTVLGNWYRHYFQNNRWRFMNRTATAGPPGDDFTTWDLPRLFSRIDTVFRTALADPDALKKIPVSDYDDLLVKGNMPDIFRPTLYDFLAHESLSFYTAGEQAGARPQDAFDLVADSPVFDDTAAFLAWQPESTDTNAAVLRALAIYRDLLQFHKDDEDRSAYYDVDLARLRYGFNTAVGETKEERYIAALKRFIDRDADHETAALALHRWAERIHADGDFVEARAIAQRGLDTHPERPGGRRCYNLIQQIEAPSISLRGERVWNAPWPTLNVQYRNMTRVHFRMIRLDWVETMKSNRNRPDTLAYDKRKSLLKKKPAREWSEDLPATPDYHQRVKDLPVPKDLAKGFYIILASPKADFSEKDNVITHTSVWISDLSLVVRPRHGKLEGFVLNALSGNPLPEVTVNSWYTDRNNKLVSLKNVQTDKIGMFTIEKPEERHRNFLVRVKRGEDALAGPQNFYVSTPREPSASSRTVFFTDRALYRPGQTVHYKGICLRVDTAGDNYTLLPGQKVTVVFEDPNRKEIARQVRQANDYGSIAGNFTAPRDRVMGRMRIRVDGGPNGSTRFNVEEYKRPKFEVNLEVPEVAAKLNEPVNLKGLAESYTGAAIDGANVKYRIVRHVRMPYWWGWYSWRRPQPRGNQEIAHGTATTAKDGTFPIQFVARPDLSVDPEHEPVFEYTVHADVTDGSGETRSSQRVVRVGYTALQATLNADSWQTKDKPVSITLRTASLDGEPQIAEGTLKVHRLKEPDKVHRPHLSSRSRHGGKDGDADVDWSDPNAWPLGEVVVEAGWTTDAEGNVEKSFTLGVGHYRVVLETQDRFGKSVTGRLPLRVLDPESETLSLKIPHLLDSPTWILEPGEDFMALWGTGYEKGRALVEIEHRNKILERYWTGADITQLQIKQTITEAMRGGLILHVTQVRENRAFLKSHHIGVPWSNKELEVTWEHFVSKLEPARKETWTAVISGPRDKAGQRETKIAEMVAALYDESLDQFRHHNWMQRFNVFHRDRSSGRFYFANAARQFSHLAGSKSRSYRSDKISYRTFPRDLVTNFIRFGWGRGGNVKRLTQRTAVNFSAAAPKAAPVAAGAMVADAEMKSEGNADGLGRQQQAAAPGPDLSEVSARKNLDETAFFFPQLIADSNGVVRMEFTMPEALTRWHFMGFVHDKELRSGFLEDHVVTSKDLMIQPNPPRFLREGDELEFTVKVMNQGPARQAGKVRLSLSYAANQKSADADLGNRKMDLEFDIPSKESRSFSWRLKVPDGCQYLTYKAVGSTGRLSDGEEGYLPVLTRRIFVTESLPLPIRGPGSKKFEFEKLLASGKSKTLEHHALTVQMVSNPSWYAVLALPYLMEFPHACNEQTFNRLYANSLARSIANSDPKIRRVFDQWKNTPALDSPMEKNQDLKAVLIEETPWFRQAKSESEARRNVGVLFDDNRLNSEVNRDLRRLKEDQLQDGSWSWFPGGRRNDYITLYITTGFGRLRHLGVDVPVDSAVRALNRLDDWMQEKYTRIQRRAHPEKYVPTSIDALYLYGRSFFLEDRAIQAKHKKAVDFFLARSRDHWLKVGHRQSQGHLALALHRFGDEDTSRDIMISIKERSVTNEEMGMFWREAELSWWWYRAPIETQALMIEAFDEVMGDAQAVEECRVWLLKQKQTQDWKTTKATADAVYGLLLRGRDILASDELVEVFLGGREIKPDIPGRPQERDRGPAPAVEAGTGFYEKRFHPGEITSKLGKVTVTKSDKGVAWGSVHWQYFEDISKITPHEGTPLTLTKALFTKVNTKKGPVLNAVKGPVRVGDELVVRLELRVDRDMEYVHLKDHRGSGTEPVNVLSRYKYQDGLAYYESTRDTASHFFIDYLPKGVYVFEYSTRIQHRGAYQTGLAEIQCMYAPEFNSHSQSLPLTVN